MGGRISPVGSALINTVSMRQAVEAQAKVTAGSHNVALQSTLQTDKMQHERVAGAAREKRTEAVLAALRRVETVKKQSDGQGGRQRYPWSLEQTMPPKGARKPRKG